MDDFKEVPWVFAVSQHLSITKNSPIAIFGVKPGEQMEGVSMKGVLGVY